MVDPLAEVVSLLQPAAGFSKLVSARGPWRVRRTEPGRLFYCLILAGSIRLDVPGHAPLVLARGDFALLPAAVDFTASSVVPPKRGAPSAPVTRLPGGEFRHGPRGGEPDVRMLLGYCTFGSPDAALLVSLLPKLLVVREEPRLAMLVQLVREESVALRPGRDVVLARLLEVLLIEALRGAPALASSPGLVRGLGGGPVATALRRLHENPSRAWTVAQLAKAAGVSRSTLFERFTRAVGVPPMEYLLAWRVAQAKALLERGHVTVAEVAARVGYSSASTFSVAFSRHVGMPPTHYARARTS